jgi:hypothetical protein
MTQFGPPSESAVDDLFGKLDSLISKHQGSPGGRSAPAPVPVLTEAVDADDAQRLAHDIPVLDEAVDLSAPSGAIAEKRRQLQVALYLRLRQCLDAELQEAMSTHPAFIAAEAQPELARITQELRAALPQIVRDSVAQVLGPDGTRE